MKKLRISAEQLKFIVVFALFVILPSVLSVRSGLPCCCVVCSPLPAFSARCFLPLCSAGLTQMCVCVSAFNSFTVAQLIHLIGSHELESHSDMDNVLQLLWPSLLRLFERPSD